MCSPNLRNNKKTLSQKYIQKKTLKIVMTSQRRCHLRQGLWVDNVQKFLEIKLLFSIDVKTLLVMMLMRDNALAEIGALICDPDVLFALRNLKSIGQSMQQSHTGSHTAHRQFQVPNPNRKTCLFRDDDTVRGMKQEEAENEKIIFKSTAK